MKFFCVFLLLALSLIESRAQKTYLGFDGKVYPLSITNFKGTDYFAFDIKTQKLIGRHPDFEKYTYRLGSNSFHFLPGSKFFILFDTFGNENDFQMQKPAILVGDNLFIPLRSFLDCLSNSGLFESSFSQKSFAFRYKQIVKNNDNFTKDSKANIEDIDKTKKQQPQSKINKKINKEVRPFEQSSTPRLVFTNYERFSLVPAKEKQMHKLKKGEIVPQKNNHNDTLGKVPPKFYVLPPELKNNPK
ncbi:MAG: hypothetical protein ACP5LT_06345 [Candidatus Kapaibacteriota bacterium]